MEKMSGIILSRYKYKESILVNFLTSAGIIKIVARGAIKPKAKLRGVIELFDLVRLELIKGRSRYILVGGRLIKRPLYLRKSLEKSLFLMSLSEITQTIVAGEDTKKVLNFWIMILKELKTLEDNQLLEFFAFALAHLLYLEGLLDQELGYSQIPKTKDKKQFLIDLINSPFKELIKNNYQKKEFRQFILKTKDWLTGEGVKTNVLDLFMKNQY